MNEGMNERSVYNWILGEDCGVHLVAGLFWVTFEFGWFRLGRPDVSSWLDKIRSVNPTPDLDVMTMTPCIMAQLVGELTLALTMTKVLWCFFMFLLRACAGRPTSDERRCANQRCSHIIHCSLRADTRLEGHGLVLACNFNISVDFNVLPRESN